MPNRPHSSIQGNILKGFARKYAKYLILRFDQGDAKERRTKLAGILESHVTSAWRQAEITEVWRQTGASAPVGMFGLSYSGYRELGLASQAPKDRSLGGRLLESTMKRPISYRNPDISLWEQGYADRIDAFLLLADDDEERLGNTVTAVRDAIGEIATITVQEHGCKLTADQGDGSVEVEHFGFRDQLSGSVDPETILTRENEQDPDSGLGCFAVFMKLEQHVEEFNRRLTELASIYSKMHAPVRQRDVGAMVMGRYKNGVPLATLRGDLDSFDFRDDAAGDKCPLQAHIRVMNPRDGKPPIPIVRRGMSFGSPEVGAAAPARGLLFLALHRSLLEFLGLMSRALVLRDPILASSVDWNPEGTETTHCTHGVRAQRWKAGDAEVCYPFADVTTLRGGEFFYVPSMDFLRGLGALPDPGAGAPPIQPG